MTDQRVQFLPFHAINEFMRPDYREEVVRFTLTELHRLPNDFRASIDRLTKNLVRVPGFRNGSKAPLGVRVHPMCDAFEKSPMVVAVVLHVWAEEHPELRQQVHQLLTDRNWDVMPPEADRTKLPGFLTRWPKGEDFELLVKAFAEQFPEVQASSDDVSLMVVWVSGRLPYDVSEEDEEDEEDETQE